VVSGFDAAVFALCCGPIRCKLPGPPTSASLLGRRSLCIRAFVPQVASSKRRTCYQDKLVDSLDRTCTDWVNDGTGCTDTA
jgi:hypothetical protein